MHINLRAISHDPQCRTLVIGGFGQEATQIRIGRRHCEKSSVHTDDPIIATKATVGPGVTIDSANHDHTGKLASLHAYAQRPMSA